MATKDLIFTRVKCREADIKHLQGINSLFYFSNEPVDENKNGHKPNVSTKRTLIHQDIDHCIHSQNVGEKNENNLRQFVSTDFLTSTTLIKTLRLNLKNFHLSLRG